ncbi:hypothetical protein AEY52_02810 [Helicobacter pylori]|nr:hypothetical protein AEY52_02810 [Helicobacter pylori]
MALTPKSVLKTLFGYYSIIFLTIFFKTLDRIWCSSHAFKSKNLLYTRISSIRLCFLKSA